MDLAPYIESLHRQLAVAAAAGGEDARALAERLTAPLDAAARLMLLEVLSAAAGEITSELAPGSVDVRLRGGDPELVVVPPPADDPAGEVAPPPAPAGPGSAPAAAAAEDSAQARINLRLPEHLKARVEDAAAAAGLSVNAWLVRALGAAVDPQAARPQATTGRTASGGGSYSGWVA
jgi:predicted HicB family RNase H-like nuclease